MSPIQKKVKELCNTIWRFRKDKNIWIDKEIEQQKPELLIYKRLDGLRSILFLLNQHIININELSFKKELINEIKDLVNAISDQKYFYPSPYCFLVEIQPDNYIDMASHCLIFGLHVLNLHNIDIGIKAEIRRLIEKSLDTLIKKDNYYEDKSENLCAWAGTTLYENNKSDVELKNVYFTSLAVIALGEWIRNPVSANPDPIPESKIKKIRDLINNGCRWILTQRNNQGNILITNIGKVDNITNDELITINAVGLKACLLNIDNISKIAEKKLVEEYCINFINFLKTEKPKKVDWYHFVLSKKVSLQYYENRQETFGIISFLALANQFLKEKSPLNIEDTVDFFINEFFTSQLDLVSILPYYSEDFFYVNTYYNKQYANINVSLRTIRKAIKKAVTEQSFIDNLSNLVIKNVFDITEEERLKEFDNKTKGKLNIKD